ncbi:MULTISPECIES: hypothetical protein [Terrabacteria group]|uniref:hypothetical protein n=1 Tax=Bacillati TaxID=1783272 RepID=UPI001C6DFBC6|nr:MULTISPECIES: hypothetical protein [Terrabacteria group]MBW9212587.1 hypothetical protein [Trueperella sp. zg.1013]
MITIKFPKKKNLQNKFYPLQSKKSQWISLGITLVFMLIAFYIFIPAIHIKNFSFWLFLLATVVGYVLVNSIICAIHRERPNLKPAIIMMAGLVGIMLLGTVAGLRIWHAKRYASILKIEEGDKKDIPSVEGASSIALMDTASAEKLGDRKIGSLTDVVSQFNVGPYTQIDYQSSPTKVAALQYEGFFKWWGNHKEGVPGYVKVNPVTMAADYVPLKEKMRYVPSAYFNDDLSRRIRFRFPTVMFENLHFEIDEQGNPWYVATTYDHTISLFGGKKVTGAILVNPITGDMKQLGLKDIPQWMDVVFHGDLLMKQYNDAVQLHKGFWNSIFGQKDCRQTTTVKVKDDDGDSSYKADYGYVAKNGDIWVFTGVTSVNGDSSNIGFMMANERTGKTRFIMASGADEGSAMHSAEGEVQEKGYHASFPSLINVDGTPTYIMVLKDNSGLVKQYACVNVEQYNLVVTASNQKDVIDRYRRLMKGEITADEAKKSGESQIDTSKFVDKTIQVKKLEKIDIGGNTHLYILDTEGKIYQAKYADVLKMLSVKEGDKITIQTDGKNYLIK